MDTIRPRTGLVSPGLERLARDAAHGAPDPTTSAATRRLLAALAASSSLFVLGAGLALRQAPLASQVIDLRRESLGLVLLPLGAWAVVLVEAAQTRDVLVRQLSRRAFDPGRAPATASPAVQWRLEDLAREQYGHATVYSSFVPFVGSGVPFSTWSLVLDLQRPSRRRLIDGRAPSPRISVVDLQARVVAQLGHLAGERLDGGERLTRRQLVPGQPDAPGGGPDRTPAPLRRH